MASVARIAAAIAAILVHEGVNYAQSKTVFKAARRRAGLHAAPEHRASVQRLTVEEELRFFDQAYAQSGRTGMCCKPCWRLVPARQNWSSSGSRISASPSA